MLELIATIILKLLGIIVNDNSFFTDLVNELIFEFFIILLIPVVLTVFYIISKCMKLKNTINIKKNIKDL